jgi:cobalt/nickel transport system ATP-binding protein
LENAVEIENLSYDYPDGHEALHDIALTIGKNETVSVIGPNGAGKSTLLLHLNGIVRSDGAIKILGTPLTEKNIKWVRSKVGLVFQNPDDQLFSPTVFDDVAFGPLNMGLAEEEIRSRVQKALAMVSMEGYDNRSPQHLSVGEKKRIAIATVLSMDTEILVFDEPSANLDPRAKWDLVALIERLSMTKIIASHDLELVRTLSGRTVILDKGHIVCDGSTEEILSDVSLLEKHGLAPASRISKSQA